MWLLMLFLLVTVFSLGVVCGIDLRLSIEEDPACVQRDQA